MNSTSKTILAVMGAAAVGAVIGMLVAPEKGSDLRRKITDATGDWSSQLQDLIAQGKEQLNTLKNRAKHEASDYASKAEDRINTMKEKV